MLDCSLPTTSTTCHTPAPQSDRIWRRQRRAGTLCEHNLRDRQCAILRFPRIHSFRETLTKRPVYASVLCDSTIFIHIDAVRSHWILIRVGLCENLVSIEHVHAVWSCQNEMMMMTTWNWTCSNSTHFHRQRLNLFPCRKWFSSWEDAFNPIKSIWTQNL